MNLISIIVPFYNGEQHLEKIIPNLLTQTYQNFELLLVDNGSTDHSKEIYERYAGEDCRVHLLYEATKGVSYARNKGLQNAAGDYIVFVDADDYLKEDYLERLIHEIETQNADVACCQCCQTRPGYQLEPSQDLFCLVQKSRVITDYTEVIHDYLDNVEQYGCVVWGKIIKAPLAKSVQFEAHKYAEDVQYMLRVLKKAKKIALFEYTGYYYVRWNQSVTKGRRSLDFERVKDIWEVNKELAEEAAAVGLAERVEKRLKVSFIALPRASALVDIASMARYEGYCKAEFTYLKDFCRVPRKIALEMDIYRFAPCLYHFLIHSANWARERKRGDRR